MNPRIIGMLLIALILLAGGWLYKTGKLNFGTNATSTPQSQNTTAPNSPQAENYRSTKHGFKLSYPANYTLTESIFNDGINADSWTLVHQRENRPAAQPVDCGVRYPDEFYLGIGIVDLQATTTNLKSFATLAKNRYADPTYFNETRDGKQLKVKRNIPGMCDNSTEVLWKSPNGRYILIFNFPAQTEREQDYWNVIKSVTFGS